jgi:hypothetical protein
MVSTYKYDAAGNRTFEGYKNGAASLEAATVVWDAMDRMTSLSDTGDQGNAPISTSYAYDLNGNIRHMLAQYDGLDSQGNVIHTAITEDYWYKYDSMNRFTTSKGSLSGTAGNPNTTIVRGTGDGMDIAYNDAGQRAAVTTSTLGQWDDHEDNGTVITYYYTDNATESYSCCAVAG